MKKVKKNIINLILTFLITMSLGLGTAHAAEIDCSVPVDGSDPNPLQLICPIQRGLGFITNLGMVAVLVMIFITAMKYATAQGDPKAMQGAKETLTYTVIGFAVILLTFSVGTILSNTFDLKVQGGAGEENVLIAPFAKLEEGWKGILRFAEIDY